MSSIFRLVSQGLGIAAVSALVGAPAFAATTLYTSQATFLAAVAPGFYTETFTGVADAAGSYSYSGGAFGYTVTAAPEQGFDDDVYLSGTFIGNFYSNASLTVTFTSGAPTAIGGNFYITDINDAFVPAAPVIITLSDGTTTTYTPSSVTANSYRGFTSTVAITSLTLSVPGTGRFNTIDNFTVGRVAAVPEPGSYALMAGGLLALAGVVRRRRVK